MDWFDLLAVQATLRSLLEHHNWKASLLRHSVFFMIQLLHCAVQSFSHVRLCETPWTVAHQAPLSIGFPRQEYWSGLPFPSPGNLPNPRIKPGSHALQADSLRSEPPGKPQNTGVGSLSLLQGIFLTELLLSILSEGSFQERKCKTQ